MTDWLRRFFDWWLSELTACLPDEVRRLLSRRQASLVVELSERRALFSAVRGEDSEFLGGLDLQAEPGPAQTAAARQLRDIAKLGAAPLELRLPRSRVLRRLVELPAAAAENLREVLSFEMDRHTPFKAAEVFYDYKVVPGGSDKSIRVDLAVVPHAAAEQALNLARSWGWEPARLGIAASDDDGGHRGFNLLPAQMRRGRSSFGGRVSIALGLFVFGLLAVAVYLPLVQQQEVLATTETRLKKVRAEAEAAQRLQEQVDRMIERSRYVVSQRLSRPTVSAVLSEMSTRLPDDTWVVQFGWRDERIVLSGFSAKPSALISILEESDMMTEVRFNSPVTRDPKVNLERFNLTASVAEAGGS